MWSVRGIGLRGSSIVVVSLCRGIRLVRGRIRVLVEGTGIGGVIIPEQDARASEVNPMLGSMIA